MSYLGQRELIKAKLVCKDWHKTVKGYTKRMCKILKTEAFLSPVTCYATIDIPWCDWEMTVNQDKEVHIIKGDKYIQLDLDNLCLQSWRPIQRREQLIKFKGMFTLPCNMYVKGHESKFYSRDASGSNTLIARLPIRITAIHHIDIGITRVLCHGQNAEGKKKLIVFDMWNPDSARKENVNVTEMNLREEGLQ